MSRWREGAPLRILDFDSECRPLSYMGSDYTSGEITAIAAGWVGEKKVHAWCLGDLDSAGMLGGFLELYRQADIVSGHYCRKHDLPILAGACLEFGFGRMPGKLVSDTHTDLVKHKYLPANQESLAQMFGLSEPKQGMSQADWREGNRLTPSGIAKTRGRVVADVVQHKAMRARLVAEGALRSPSWWSA